MPVSLFVVTLFHYRIVKPGCHEPNAAVTIGLSFWLVRKWRVTINTEKLEAIYVTRKFTSACQSPSLEWKPLSRMSLFT